MRRRGAALVALVALGCSMAPRYERPRAPIPSQWPSSVSRPDGPRTAPAAVRHQDILRDPQLQALIASALRNSRELRIAAESVVSARAQYRVARAGLFPRIDANAGVTVGGGAAATGALGPSTGGAGDVYQIYSANLAATSFELDLFGRVRSLSEAARQAYFATQAGAQATRIAVVSELSLSYLTLAADRSLLRIAQETAQNARESADLARARLVGGVSQLLDLRQAETIVAQAQASIAARRTAVEQDLNALDLLAGQTVNRALLPASLEDVSSLVVELPAGLESEVLLRRPDVMQAELLLRSVNARIGAARAAFFPTISLTGVLGFASSSLGSLFSSGAFGWSVRPGRP